MSRSEPRDSREEISGYVRRARRTADFSQRDLAAAVGMPQSMISRIEAGRRVDVSDFVRILNAAGLRMVVVDERGAEVSPVAADVLRDGAGRRQPAHLDVHAAPELPAMQVLVRRCDPWARESWHHRRAVRDRLRARPGGSAAGPPDQPTSTTLAAEKRARQEQRAAHARARAHELLAVGDLMTDDEFLDDEFRDDEFRDDEFRGG